MESAGVSAPLSTGVTSSGIVNEDKIEKIPNRDVVGGDVSGAEARLGAVLVH